MSKEHNLVTITASDLAILDRVRVLVGDVSRNISLQDFIQALIDNGMDATSAAELASTANGKGASLIGIEDTVDGYTSTDVEGALNESVVAADAIAVRVQALEDIEAETSADVPVGTVVMFNAAFSNIPVNWQLCDGSNGTPNMTNRFVYGTVTEGEITQLGGLANAIVPTHSHNFTGTAMADHSHTLVSMKRHSLYPDYHHASQSLLNGGDQGEQYTSAESAGVPAGSISTEGESLTNKNLPPYIKLAYIQRMT